MRVIHPREFESIPKKKPKKSKLPLILLVLVIALAAFIFTQRDSSQVEEPGNVQQNNQSETNSQPSNIGSLKHFTGEEFKQLARSIKYPNLQFFTEPPIITGNVVADNRIRSIAESRGYVLTGIPVSAIEKINEPRLEGDDLLQPFAAIAWRDLKSAAEKDNIPLSLLSGYRSPEYQRQLFVSRLGVTVEQIAAGQVDPAINRTLTITAVPGYSRHHTGYTIDLWCEDGSVTFVDSSCFKWIHTENYKIAKENGWIPSYPDDVELQGPEPEPWEYVWVGRELVSEQ